ncbi:MAG: DUF4136 domain-containing protein [Pseudomonadota bacterium]
MKKSIQISFLSLFLGAIVGCASKGTVTNDYDAEQNFAAYETFSWADEKPMTASGDYPVSGLMEQQFMNSIKDTLTDKGYVFVEDVAEADFAVSFTVGARDEIEFVDKAPIVIPDGSWAYVAYDSGVYARDYHEGSLGIDIFDVDRRVSVWHGVGEKRLSDKELKSNADPTEAIEEILAEFPRN